MANVYVVRGQRGLFSAVDADWPVKAFFSREDAQNFIEKLSELLAKAREKARGKGHDSTWKELHEIQDAMWKLDSRFQALDFQRYYVEEVDAEIAEDTDLVDDVSIQPKVLSTHFIPVDRTMLQRAVHTVDEDSPLYVSKLKLHFDDSIPMEVRLRVVNRIIKNLEDLAAANGIKVPQMAKPKSKFYTYSQNNSGGSWAKGMPNYLIVEATSESDADRRAVDAGVYFNGVDEGYDCECCGDRWYSPEPGTDEPLVYGKHPSERKPFLKGDLAVRIIYIDGQIQEY